MDKLRTPDERFRNLDGFPFAPHYLDIGDGEGGTLRLHYVDEGPRDGDPILLFHGEPTWSYLYRKMIPGLAAAGHRVLAPDLIGHGRSDKPTQQSDYSISRHVDWLRQWIAALDIKGATWFGQDWGSILGLLAVTAEAQRFKAITIGNGILPDPNNLGRFVEFAMKAPDIKAFSRWQAWIKDRTSLDCGAVINGRAPGLEHARGFDLTAAECAAYDAPYPDGSYQASALVFPFLADRMSEAEKALCTEAWRVLEGWTKPFVTAYGKKDHVLGWADEVFHKYVPGAKGQPHRSFPDGTHFIQEEEPQALNAVINEVMARVK